MRRLTGHRLFLELPGGKGRGARKEVRGSEEAEEGRPRTFSGSIERGLEEQTSGEGFRPAPRRDLHAANGGRQACSSGGLVLGGRWRGVVGRPQCETVPDSALRLALAHGPPSGTGHWQSVLQSCY